MHYTKQRLILFFTIFAALSSLHKAFSLEANKIPKNINNYPYISLNSSSLLIQLIKNETKRQYHTQNFNIYRTVTTKDGIPFLFSDVILLEPRDPWLKKKYMLFLSQMASKDTDFNGRWSIPPEEIVATLKNNIKRAIIFNPVPVIYKKRATYLVNISTTQPVANFDLVVDAENGDILDVIGHSFTAYGYIYEHNPVVDDSFTKVELKDLLSDQKLSGNYADVYQGSCNGTIQQSCEKRRVASPDENGDYLYEPLTNNSYSNLSARDDSFPEVNMYHHINIVHNYFKDTQDFEGNQPTLAAVNYTENGNPYDNAAYVPRAALFNGQDGLLFGQGTLVDFAYDADVIYHEYTHSVIGQTSNLVGFDYDEYGPKIFAPALNEASADYFSATIENDPLLSEYALGTFGQSRRLDNNKSCPLDLYGEWHTDGEIWSGAMWDIRDLLGQDMADRLVFDTVVSLPSDSDFDTAAKALIQMAENEGLDSSTIDEIDSILQRRGLYGCKRIVPLLDLTEPHKSLLIGKDLIQSFGGTINYVTSALQYRLDLPVNVEKIKFTLSAHPNVKIFVRKDLRITHDVQFSYITMSITVSSLYDFEISGNEIIDINNQNGTYFEPGHTYYLQLINEGATVEPLFYASISVKDETNNNKNDQNTNNNQFQNEEKSSQTGCSCSNTSLPNLFILIMELLIIRAFFVRKGYGTGKSN